MKKLLCRLFGHRYAMQDYSLSWWERGNCEPEKWYRWGKLLKLPTCTRCSEVEPGRKIEIRASLDVTNYSDVRLSP